MRRAIRTTVASLATVLALAGCAGSQEESAVPTEPTPSASPADPGPASTAATPSTGPTPAAPSGRPSRATTDLPTMGPPTAPPSQPTDLRKANLVAGRITRGGAGPCYGLVTDDGREYALHGAGKGDFATGTWVRVTIGPADPTVDCGPGTPASIVTISPVG
ncbi:hypothetical protein Q3W71_07965 [Micromonospora sp. C28SCA-DRY-2]|uniref:hypothetical protein n=1 Tax=Micromonospora sp. C28SCA-DRY-2 TaxID=3059522 RepID=UPI0026745607|nr:hypothetical protein [Micromonospora sp. C28SCA-DRY-2]MDO3701613.1 hypothetical protein [Micromonospora sp. C28SCA-DRY-2]